MACKIQLKQKTQQLQTEVLRKIKTDGTRFMKAKFAYPRRESLIKDY